MPRLNLSSIQEKFGPVERASSSLFALVQIINRCEDTDTWATGHSDDYPDCLFVSADPYFLVFRCSSHIQSMQVQQADGFGRPEQRNSPSWFIVPSEMISQVSGERNNLSSNSSPLETLNSSSNLSSDSMNESEPQQEPMAATHA